MNKEWSEVKQFAGAICNNKEQFEVGTYIKHYIFNDIKHLSFTLSRYKFVSKLLAYEKNLAFLELGCNEAIGGLLLRQNNDVRRYVGIDFDEFAIKWNMENLSDGAEYYEADIFNLPSEVKRESFDVVFSLDVIEHIESTKEKDFLRVMWDNVKEGGCAIIGTPNIAMSPYASEGSRIGHINLYNQKRLHDLCKQYFENVMMFGMNDETVNVGFEPMTCYAFAVCTGKKRDV